MEAPSLAEAIQQRIRQTGLSQRKFADRIGLTSSHLNSLVTGKISLPTPEVRRRLAQELGISHVQLLVLVGELRDDEIREAGIEGIIEEGPVHQLKEVVGKYDWEWEDAARLADMIEAYAKPSGRSMMNRRDT